MVMTADDMMNAAEGKQIDLANSDKTTDGTTRRRDEMRAEDKEPTMMDKTSSILEGTKAGKNLSKIKTLASMFIG